MSRIHDLKGNIYGRLEVIEFSHMEKNGQGAMWKCKCECGNEKIIQARSLTKGHTKSCGCLKSEKNIARFKEMIYTHGGTGTRLHGIWRGMKSRCHSNVPKNIKTYVSHGIVICEEWSDFAIFRKWALENGYQEDLTIDRIDVTGNYSPSNCRWATQAVQQRNRGNNLYLTHNGITMHLMEWAEKVGVKYATLKYRIHKRPDDSTYILRQITKGVKL